MPKSRTEAEPPEEKLKRITVLIDEETHRRLKIMCATHGLLMMEVTRDALEAQVKLLEKKTPTRRKARAATAETRVAA